MKTMGLGKIFIFAVFAGISFTFSYNASGNASDVGFASILLNQISQTGDSQIQAAILILSIVLTIFSIFNLARFMRQVYDKRLAGIVTAVFGFLGSFLVLSSSQEQNFVVIGFVIWIIGIVVIILGRKN